MKPEQILEMIRLKTGLELKLCDYFTGVRTHKGKKYFNALLSEKIGESREYYILKRFADKYKTISVQPKGSNRVAIFSNKLYL